jgi:hypothetical protein
MKIYRYRLDQPPITRAELEVMRLLILRSAFLFALAAMVCLFGLSGDSGVVAACIPLVALVFLLHLRRGLHEAETSQEDKLASMREMDLIDKAHLAFIQQVALLNRRLTYGEAEGLIAGARAAEMKRRRDSLYQSPRAER